MFLNIYPIFLYETYHSIRFSVISTLILINVFKDLNFRLSIAIQICFCSFVIVPRFYGYSLYKARCITELAAPSLSRRDETFRATILERNIENSSDSAEFANFLNPQITNEASKLRASKAVNKIIWIKDCCEWILFFYFLQYIINFKIVFYNYWQARIFDDII